MKHFYKLFFSIFLFFSFHSTAFAQIIITEVYPNPGTDELEWIEIYNTSDNEFDLSSWKLEDTLSSPSLLKEFNSEIIASKSHMVITLNQNKLNNSGDTVTLYNHKNQVIEKFNYGASTSEKSFSKTIDNQNNYQADIEITTATLGEYSIYQSATPIPTPSPTPTSTVTSSEDEKIYISNYQACPATDEDEWVEIINQGESKISLSGWLIQDKNGNQVFFQDTDEISKNEALKISWSHSLLNNSGDDIFLKNSAEETIDSLSYIECNNSNQINSNLETNNNEPKMELDSNTVKSSKISSKTENIKHKNALLIIPNISRVKSQLTPPINHNEFISVEKRPSKSGTISVIIGGLVLLLSGLIINYES